MPPRVHSLPETFKLTGVWHGHIKPYPIKNPAHCPLSQWDWDWSHEAQNLPWLPQLAGN